MSGLSLGPRLRLLWDLVIAVVIATIAVQYRTESTSDVAIGLAMAAALVVRRRNPRWVMTAVSVLAVGQVLLTPSIPAGYDLAVLVAMTAVVTHTPRLRDACLAGAVVAVGVAVLAADSIDPRSGVSWFDQLDLATYLSLLVACIALWLFAYTLRTNKERTVYMVERAAVAERERDQLARLAAADERAAIARELHDVVAHGLAVMIAQADGASFAIDRNPGMAAEAMRTVAKTGRDALDDMHRIVAVLRGGQAEDATDRRAAGLAELETLLDRARQAGLRVTLDVSGERPGLSATEELTIFRLVQEGLTNALRHAGPGARVTLALRFAAAQAVVDLADDGAGRPAENGSGRGGNGLIGMRERVAVLGGEFTAGPRPETGWRVRAVLPIKETV